MENKKMTSKQMQTEIDRLKQMEWAIVNTYGSLDEIFSLMILAREYLKGDNFSKHTMQNANEAIFSRLIDIQASMMDIGLKKIK